MSCPEQVLAATLYHDAMRYWLVLFMVLLLPLRGLVGDVMAGQMLQQHAAAAVSVQAHAGHQAAAPALPAHDCAEHHAQAQAEAPAVDAQAAGDCPTCASCQMCSSVALSPAVDTASPRRASQPPPDTVQRAYPSAEPVLAFKPPRS
jgi:hypothetical protein